MRKFLGPLMILEGFCLSGGIVGTAIGMGYQPPFLGNFEIGVACLSTLAVLLWHERHF